MDTPCTVLLFLANPTLSPLTPGMRAEWGGTFACPASHPDALHFLDEALGKENLSRVQTGEPMTFSAAADWGRFEDLKAQMAKQGFGLRLMKIPTPA